jgi:two-component system phosphate regulon sensor histidine kinase PhoR
VVCAWYVSRRLSDGLDALGKAFDAVGAGEILPPVDPEVRYLIEPTAAALDRCREPLAARFAQLQASTDQLRGVLNSMVEGVIALDDAQRVLLVNDSARTMFRLQSTGVRGRPLWEQVRNHKLHDLVTQAITERRPVEMEVEVLSPPGSRILQVRAAPLPSADDNGAIVVASDVSELRHLEQVRQQFVSNASHELKTPIASIRLALETLLDGAIGDPDNAIYFLETANAQTERLEQLVRDMLSLTRIESDQMPLQVRPMPVHTVVDRCVERQHQQAERKQIALRVERPAEPVFVLADEEAFQQILDNLVDNAIKYTNPHGRVLLRWRRDGDVCRLSVEDNGIGIPQTQLPRIFERFYRVDAARSRELGGTGLGLSIVKHLVQGLKGTVDVESQIGRGSTFTIELPAVDQPADEGLAETEPALTAIGP